MSGMGLKALPEVRDRSKFTSKGLGWVGRPSRWSGMSLKALPEVQE